MIYLLLSGASAFYGLATGLGPATLLRPLLDAVSPLSPTSVAALCTLAALSSALVAAFFTLSRAPTLPTDELLLLAVGAALGGVLGDLSAARFFRVLAPNTAVFLQNALFFALIGLSAVYFAAFRVTLRPLAATRLLAFPVALGVGLLGAFLSFGAEPLTLAIYFWLFDADNDEAAEASLTVALFAMLARFVTLLIRERLRLPEADAMLWLLPGALAGAILAMLPGVRRAAGRGTSLLPLSLFTGALNLAACAIGG